jgi:hypothetical protein
MKKIPALLSKSTHTAAQQERVLAMLIMRPHSSHEMHQHGIYHPPQRIRELRGMGYPIETHRVTLVDEWGYSHRRCAMYELHAPTQEGCAV